MSTDQRNLPAFLDVNATFQTWVQGIHAQLAACGLIQTADTGQINPATVALPSAGSQGGYEIWRLNDAAQSTQPVYIKIEYGTNNTSQNRCSLWVTVGSGSNGTGTITGTTSGRQATQATVSQSGAGVTQPSYCSGDGGWIGLFTNGDPTNGNAIMGFIVDRIRDTNAAPTGEGFVLSWINNSGNNVPAAVSVQNNLLSATAGANASAPDGVFPGPTPAQGGGNAGIGGGFRLIGQSLAVMPCMVLAGQLRYLKCGVIYSTQELGQASGVAFTANNFGINHTYMTMPRCGQAWGNNSNDFLAMLWE